MGTRFATTNWTVVLRARDAPTTEARRALGELCAVYWYPVYAFIRSRGVIPADAEDLTQAYFTRFLVVGRAGAWEGPAARGDVTPGAR